MACLKFLLLLGLFSSSTFSLELKNGAYEDFVIKVGDNVPEANCKEILHNLKITLTSASQYLFSALNSRAFLRSATVLLPPTWSDSCVPSDSAVLSGAGETPDMSVLPSDPARGAIWTQQSLGCGQPGDQIYMGFQGLVREDKTLARSLIKEFAMYRYGVFEEQGYFNDPIYPMCYYDDVSKQGKVTGCSDWAINDNGICSPSSSAKSTYNTSEMVNEKARSSIMFAAEAPFVSMFCDEGNHDRMAPTKHNLMCQRRSVLDVIMSHTDFSASENNNDDASTKITDTTPKIQFKRQNLTRYVFVIENTKNMIQRESWTYLRLALRQLANILPNNVEVGMVLSDAVVSTRVLQMVTVDRNHPSGNNNRDIFYSALPYTPNDYMQPACLHCGLKEAMNMLNDRTKTHGSASNIIVAIAPGMKVDAQLTEILKSIKKSKIRIASINYPDILRPKTLQLLADETDGVDYTVFEQKLNVDTTLLTTYFELHTVLYDIIRKFHSGNEAELPMEIHRREINDDGRNSITGSFMLDPNMGEPAQFNFFTHNSDAPLIKKLKLISPTHQSSTNINDKYLHLKMLTLNANISETGTWTYTVEPYTGNPQPHILQIMATPKSNKVPVIRTNFRAHRNAPGEPLILLAEVKYGNLPILGAKVEVTVVKPDVNVTVANKFKFELLDTGAGDPDITKGDGIYSRYFSAAEWGPGLYTFEVVISDNGNTAYTWTNSSKYDDEKPCCGSSVSSNSMQPISPFQRVLPKKTLLVSSEQIVAASQIAVGRIGDLKVEVIPEDMKARLSWTSPDMGGNTVSRYEIKHANSILEVTDKFETAAVAWENAHPFPLSPGSETTYTLDLSQNRELLDKPMYFAIKAYPKMSSDLSGPVSNWVRVLVPSPPPPATVPPTYSSNEQFWPNHVNSNHDEPSSPSVAQAMNVGLELILPVAIGIILLVVLLVLYCYFCVVKRRGTNGHKKSSKASEKLNSTITIIPSSPQHMQQQSTQAPAYTPSEMPDPHQVGVPISNYGYEDETKKRYSLVQQQEQQLIEELKQQQHMHYQQMSPNPYGGLSVISNGGSITRNGHTLSPYNSWSASQLLHEHERRHSPMENMMPDEQMMQHQELLMNGSQMDHMSLNGQSNDHMSLNGHYPTGHIPPPVPPLPAFNSNGYPVNYSIYGVHQAPPQQTPPNHVIYQSMPRNETLVPFNASLQGSMSSVNSGDKKRRNVTMV